MAERSWGEKFNLALWILLDTLERFFTENKLLKLISLGIALFMWFSISTQEERDRTLENLQLTVVDRSADTMVTGVPVKVVDIRVRGPLSVVTDLDPQNIMVAIDATGLEPGNHAIWLSADQVNTPPAVKVLRIDPPSIPVTIESKISRQVPVKPNIKLDSLPPDRVILESLVTPATVEATGPASKVSRLEELVTEPIDLRAVGSRVTFAVALVAPDHYTTLTPSTVRVTISLDELGEKVFTDLKPTLPKRVRAVSAQPVRVTLKGPHSLLDKIKPADIIVKLNATKLPRGEQEVAPSVELPEEYRGTIKVTSVEPEKLVVRAR